MMDAHAALLRVFEEQRVCQDCLHRIREWNPDCFDYEYRCTIVDSSETRFPLPAAQCPGVTTEMAKDDQ
jgi:hypothetical protein